MKITSLKSIVYFHLRLSSAAKKAHYHMLFAVYLGFHKVKCINAAVLS